MAERDNIPRGQDPHDMQIPFRDAPMLIVYYVQGVPEKMFLSE